MDRPECLDDIKIPNPAFPYGKVNWEHDDLACRDWALGRDMAKWEEKYNPQPEPEPEPEPESEYATSEHASPDMIRSASELKEFEKAAEQVSYVFRTLR